MNPKTLCDQYTKEQLAEKVVKLREVMELQLDKHKHWLHAPVTNDKETWCACFGCELARSALNA